MTSAQYLAEWMNGLQGETDAVSYLVAILVVAGFVRVVSRFIRPGG